MNNYVMIPCCRCGKLVDTREINYDDELAGKEGIEIIDGRWVCSSTCWDAVVREAVKFTSPEAPPEGLKRELLTILAEECAEVTQRVMKMLRFGVTEIQTGQELSNRDRLSVEVGDLQHLITRCIEEDLIDPIETVKAEVRKRHKLVRYLQSS